MTLSSISQLTCAALISTLAESRAIVHIHLWDMLHPNRNRGWADFPEENLGEIATMTILRSTKG